LFASNANLGEGIVWYITVQTVAVFALLTGHDIVTVFALFGSFFVFFWNSEISLLTTAAVSVLIATDTTFWTGDFSVVGCIEDNTIFEERAVFHVWPFAILTSSSTGQAPVILSVQIVSSSAASAYHIFSISKAESAALWAVRQTGGLFLEVYNHSFAFRRKEMDL
jgi:hypothetical protein